MKKIFLCICIFLFFCIAAGGCRNKPPETSTIESTLPNGLNIPAEALPSIDSISASNDAYRRYFSQVESATLYLNGTTQEISPTNERMLCLLNFIARSFDERNYEHMTGLVEGDEVAQWYSYSPMLEINLMHSGSDSVHTQKLLVWANSFLAVKDPTDDKHLIQPVAERYWPYMGLFRPTANSGNKNDQFFIEKSGVKPWLDLLLYTGIAG